MTEDNPLPAWSDSPGPLIKGPDGPVSLAASLRPDHGQFRTFTEEVARERLDGEGLAYAGTGADPEGEPYVLENDTAVDVLQALIESARSILGWEPGKPPLDDPELYRECEAEPVVRNADAAPPGVRAIPEHNNDLGDWCGWSGTEWRAGADTCPQYCREASVRMGGTISENDNPLDDENQQRRVEQAQAERA